MNEIIVAGVLLLFGYSINMMLKGDLISYLIITIPVIFVVAGLHHVRKNDTQNMTE